MKLNYKISPLYLGLLLIIPIILASPSTGQHSGGGLTSTDASAKAPTGAEHAVGRGPSAAAGSNGQTGFGRGDSSGQSGGSDGVSQRNGPNGTANKSSLSHSTVNVRLDSQANAPKPPTALRPPINPVGTNVGGDLRVGSRIDESRLHVVSRPGLYGIGIAPRGSKYGIVDHRLVRFDPRTLQILSVIRIVDAIRD